MLKVDSAHARKILSAQMAGLCYKQPLINGISSAWDILLRQTISVMPLAYEIYLSIKDVENLPEFILFQNLYLCSQKTVC